jgi:SAM-dependent MidA family methyltransferase
MTLEDIIKSTIIQKQSLIGFDEFMQMALYYPALGYYRNGSEKFGEKGDFITAPETSDLFGFCLAKQCCQVLNGNNDILEFGAGSGILAAQILFELGRLGNLPRRYYILELSAELKHRQAQTIRQVLPELFERVIWLSALPEKFSGVVIANEVLDAMPAKRFIVHQQCFYELGVTCRENALYYQPFSQPYQSDALPVDHLAEGYQTEVNFNAQAWVESIAHFLDEALVLVVDYGMAQNEYLHPQRGMGTLRCYYQHQAIDNPFINIGQQDITTSVNFSTIAQCAQTQGLAVLGYATQAMFLIALEIEQYLLKEKDSKKYAILAQEIKQLVLPAAMGESFKVLALSKNLPVKLQGFNEQNLKHKL